MLNTSFKILLGKRLAPEKIGFRSCIILLIWLSSVSTPAQTLTSIPPSTHALSSTRMVDAHMMNFAGVLPVDIPIYMINSGKLKHPISINYASSGNRVEEEASWIGLGFSLNAGGVISRVVRGLPDEKTDGFFNGAPTFEAVTADDVLQGKAFDNQIDSHPDIFSYQFDGNSGKIIFDREGNATLIPQRNLSITKAPDLSSLTIVTEIGTRYTFSALETAKVLTGGSDNLHPSLTSGFVSSWYLTNISSAERTSQIEFHYSAPITTTAEVTTEDAYITTTNNGYFEKKTPDSRIFTVEYRPIFLDRITFSNGELTFVRSKRDDIPDFDKLDKIEIRYLNGVLFKEFVLEHSYFNYQQSTIKKLQLSKVWEQSGSIKNSPYIFYYYNQTRVTPDVKKAVDHWGYYNGKNQKLRLPPSVLHFNTTEDPVDDEDYSLVEGEQLESDEAAVKTFMLKAVRSPMGGLTEYEYELNDVYFPTLSFSYVKASAPVVLSTGNAQQKTFTVPSNYPGTRRGAAAMLTITSECAIVGDPCAEGDPFAIVAGCPFIELTGPKTFAWGCRYDNRTYDFYLPKGTYTFKVSANANKNFSATLRYFYEETITSPKRAAGLRIVRVKTSETGKTPIVKKYTYKDDEGKTTGKLIEDFTYSTQTYSVVDKDLRYGQLLDHLQVAKDCYLKKYVRLSRISLGFGASMSAGYSRITELHGENGENGKIEYHYRTGATVPTNDFLNQKNWTRGYLERMIVFRNEQGTFKKETESIYDYDFQSYPDGQKILVGGYTTARKEKVQNECIGLIQKNKYELATYKLESDWFFLSKETTIKYDKAGNSISKMVTHGYDFNSLLRVRSSEETSDTDKKLVTLTNYPTNYSDDNSFISDLKRDHIINVPIEQVVFSENTSNNTIKILSAHVNTFRRGDNSNSEYVGRVESAYNLLIPDGKSISLSEFKFSNAPKGQLPNAPSNFTLPQEQYIADVLIEDYDPANGNPVKGVSSGGSQVLFRWGYNGDFVIFKGLNTEIGNYSSFEFDNNKGGWEYTGPGIMQNENVNAKTGTRYYDLSTGEIITGGLNPNKKYGISFWARGGIPNVSNILGLLSNSFTDHTGWKYYRAIITGTETVSLSSAGVPIQLDELVLVEADATFEACTYDPLKGKTSESNANGTLMEYAYDALGRIRVIRDQKGNITEKYEYNLK